MTGWQIAITVYLLVGIMVTVGAHIAFGAAKQPMRYAVLIMFWPLILILAVFELL